MAITKVVAVTQYIKVTIDESKFDDEFFAGFNSTIFDAGADLDEHMKHLAQLNARGIYADGDFIEGYGRTEDMGIQLDALDHSLEVEIDDAMTNLHKEPQS
jgi:hypothetical protein